MSPSDPRQAASAGRAPALPFVLAGLVLFLDQTTKALATRVFGPGSGQGDLQLLDDFLAFRYARNTGAAFGLLRGQTVALTALTIVIIGLLLAAIWRGTASGVGLTAGGFLLGGALGNLADRLRLGYVVDFIDVWRWPTFNLADAAISFGVAALGWTMLFPKDAGAESRHGAETEASRPTTLPEPEP